MSDPGAPPPPLAGRPRRLLRSAVAAPGVARGNGPIV